MLRTAILRVRFYLLKVLPIAYRYVNQSYSVYSKVQRILTIAVKSLRSKAVSREKKLTRLFQIYHLFVSLRRPVVERCLSGTKVITRNGTQRSKQQTDATITLR